MVLTSLLGTIPFFQNFIESERQAFAEREDLIHHFNKGAFIIRQGQTDEHSLYILLKGQVLVSRIDEHGLEEKITTLKPGDIIGEISFLTNRPRTTNILTLEEVIAIRIDNEAIEGFDCPLQIRLKDFLIKVLVDRLEMMNSSQMKKDEINKQLVHALRDAYLSTH
ncbi:MAG: cyclic nucleotide-binding domain-containing protein [Magnetococcales bacterium]|nr:cyclic nucleotide-binding domain-containing protein [Magnetococcales bacterium]